MPSFNQSVDLGNISVDISCDKDQGDRVDLAVRINSQIIHKQEVSNNRVDQCLAVMVLLSGGVIGQAVADRLMTKINS